MKNIVIKNISKNNIIAKNGKITTCFFDRLKGWMSKDEINEEEALLIKPCNSIHMFFMNFDIDVIFVNKNNEVCHIINGIKPWKISKVIKEASYVIEIKSKKVKKNNIEIGDTISYKYT